MAKEKETSIRNNNTVRENMREGVLIFATKKTSMHIANSNVILMPKTTRGRKSIINKKKVVEEEVIRRRRRKQTSRNFGDNISRRRRGNRR